MLLGLADTDTFKKCSILVPLKHEQSAAFYIVHTDMMMPFQSYSLELFRSKLFEEFHGSQNQERYERSEIFYFVVFHHF